MASLVFAIDSSDNSSFFVTKYFVGRRLSTLRRQWFSLRDNSAPSATSVTPFYEACLHTLAEIDDKTDLTSKKIYANLLSRTSSPPHSYLEDGSPFLALVSTSEITGLLSAMISVKTSKMTFYR